MKMRLKTLLGLQLAYAVLGIAYNMVSLFLTLRGEHPLAPTQPVLGMIAMVVYAILLIPGFLHKVKLYRVLMGVAAVYFACFGIVIHIINIFSQPQLYSSMLAWALAVAINLFGLVWNLIAVLGKFKMPAK
jgi:hypothetical protein